MTTTTETPTPTFKHPNLTAALAAFQAHVPTIEKGKTARVPMKSGGQYSYDYADLTDVTAKVLPALGAEGLAWITRTEFTDTGRFVLTYALRHESGEQVTGTWPLPADVPPQALGSALTYARRYALTAVTGVAPGGDDDDAALMQQVTRPTPEHHTQQHRTQQRRPQGPAPVRTDEQWTELTRLRDALKIDGPTLGETVAYVTGYTGDPLQLPAEAADKVITYMRERLGAAGEQTTLTTDGGEQK